MDTFLSILFRCHDIVGNWMDGNFDKCLHFLASVVLTMLFGMAMPVWMGGLVTLAIGIGKEVYDYADYGKFDWKDLIADIVGVGVIIMFYYSKI